MALFYYALCIFCIHFTTVKCIELQRDLVDSNFVVHSLPSSDRDITQSNPECDCGPKGKCKLEGGKKVCKCEYKYRQIDGFCEPYCQNSINCEHYAPCVNETCECFPGTSGAFCEIIDECEGVKGAFKCGDPESINCDFQYETHKAYCSCRVTEYLYDESRRKCVECNCDETYGTCSLVDGVKTCKCNPGSAVKREYIGKNFKCAACNCGKNSNGCSFQDPFTSVCDCKEGYYEYNIYEDKCIKCECEPHGKCVRKQAECDCHDGYAATLTKDGKNVCEACDCGGNGVCSFEGGVKKCKCDKLFAEREGKCVACQCYANDKVVDCYFEDKKQHCLCPEGYENGTFICKDKNECLEDPNACPSNTYCVNTMGSFKCPCVKGYKPKDEGGDPKKGGCVDIDECQIEEMCPRVHTRCTNLPGTYICECEWGYEPVAPYESPVIAGCEPWRKTPSPSPSPWKTGVIILGVIFGFCIVGLGIAIFTKRRSNGQLPIIDTVLQRFR